MTQPFRRWAWVLLLLAGACSAHDVSTLSGTVRRVADGDSYFVDVGEKKWIEVRVAGIDCPESDWPGRWKAQPFAAEAKALASRLVSGRQVRIEVTDRDRYGREVGEVFVDDKPVSQALVGAGLAWWNARYAPDDMRLRGLEDQARAAHRGLWADPSPEAPWRYRKRSQEGR